MYNKSKVKCYTCHKMGHYAWECYGATNDIKEEAHLVANNQETEESTLLLQNNEKEKGDKNVWYLDNGASNQLCGYKDKSIELDEKMKGIVSFEDSSKIQIEGKGTILTSSKNDVIK